MLSNSEIKNEALRSLKGRWGFACVLTVIYFVFSLATDLFPIPEDWVTWVELAYALLFTTIIGQGYCVSMLQIARGEKTQVGTLFCGFKDYKRIFICYFLVCVILSFSFFLLIVPGVIVSLMLALVPFILKDHPELGAIAVLEKSVQMMKGHKKRLFFLCLSFLGWILLWFVLIVVLAAVSAFMELSLSISVSEDLMGWVVVLMTVLFMLPFLPYCYTSVAAFYEEVKAAEQAAEPKAEAEEK